MDKTCLLWHPKSTTDPDNYGSCLIYDNYLMSMYVLGVVLTWRLMAAIAFGGALHFNKTSHVPDDEDTDTDDQEKSKA